MISVWSLPKSSNSLVQDDSASKGQLLNRLVLGSFGLSLPQRRRSSFPQPNLLASCPKSHPSRTCSRSLLHSLVLAVDYLWFSWRSRAGRSEPLSFNLAFTCTCPRSCGSVSSARIAPPCFTRLRFQLRLSSRDTTPTDMIHQCCVAWMARTLRFNCFVAESEESRPT